MKPETIARKEQEDVKHRRKQRDLLLLCGMIHMAARFAQVTNQDQWILDRLNDLSSDLDT